MICLLILEREERRGGEREWNINVRGNLNQLSPICILGICPDWGSNPKPFGVWDGAPTNWANQPGCSSTYLNTIDKNSKYILCLIGLINLEFIFSWTLASWTPRLLWNCMQNLTCMCILPASIFVSFQHNSKNIKEEHILNQAWVNDKQWSGIFLLLLVACGLQGHLLHFKFTFEIISM